MKANSCIFLPISLVYSGRDYSIRFSGHFCPIILLEVSVFIHCEKS